MKYNYKKIQKQKNSSIIDPDLIAKKRFDEIKTLLKEKSNLSNQERYLYGYSLLHTQQKWQALVVLWPLVIKGHAKIEEDCAILAADVFNNLNFLLNAELTEEELRILFIVAKKFVPKSQAYKQLKLRLFNCLWEKKDYEALEQLLKSNKDNLSSDLLQNLSKLIFFQAGKKLRGNILAFISHVLTGAASLIYQYSIYHNDIEEILRLLANELIIIFTKEQAKQRLAWDEKLFAHVVNLEASVLHAVLQHVIHDRTLNCSIIPTPGYLIHYDSACRVSEQFLPWLERHDKDLFSIYDAKSYQAVLWAFGGDKAASMQNSMKEEHYNQFHPYLRLALMLRSMNMKKPLFNHCVEKSEFDSLKDSKSVFKSLVLSTVDTMLNEFGLHLKEKCWQLLVDFYPVIEDPELKQLLRRHSLFKLHVEYQSEGELNFKSVIDIAQQLNDNELEKQMFALEQRRNECSAFLQKFANRKKINSTFTSADKLLAHLTLIADCCFLLFEEIPDKLFSHFGTLRKNTSNNRLIPLKVLTNEDLQCDCSDCIYDFFAYKMSSFAEKLKLPIVRLPKIKSDLQQPSTTQASKISFLSQPDPFKVLDVTSTDPKPIIMQKVMKLMQQSPENMAILRQAQNAIFNPAQRFIYHYLCSLSHEEHCDETDVPLTTLTVSSLNEIPFRHEFAHA